MHSLLTATMKHMVGAGLKDMIKGATNSNIVDRLIHLEEDVEARPGRLSLLG